MWLWLFVLAGLAFMVMPGLWMVLSSFKTRTGIQAVPMRLLPESLMLDNYAKAIQYTRFWQALKASLLVTTVAAVGHTFISVWGGYLFGKLRWFGRDRVFLVLLSTMMIPSFLTLIPSYVLITKLGLLNSYGGVIIPFLVGTFGIFLARQFIIGIPDELVDAAKVDGCSTLGVYWHVIVPNSKPVMAVLAVFIANSAWDDLLWSSLILTDRSKWTLPIAIANLRQQTADLYELQMAGATLAVIPVIIFFALMQRHIVQGVTMSGLKG